MTRAEDNAEYARHAPLLAEYARMAAADVRRLALRERLVVVYLPVARRIARRFAYRGEPVDDLEQVAAIGLLGALERFDPDRDRDFLAYAVPTIMGEVRRHFRDRTWTVRTPRGVKDDYLAVRKAVTSLSQHLDRAPTVPELAEHLGLAADRVREAITAGGALRPASLDEGRTEGDDGDSLAGVLGELDPDIGRVEVGALVQDLVRALPQRERTILALRFVHDKTQTEIGEVLCISQMHVSRLLRNTSLSPRGASRSHTPPRKRPCTPNTSRPTRRRGSNPPMKALVYEGPKSVSVKNVPDAMVEKPTDVLVRITTTNICGSDLHMYEGRTGLESGKILGHENMGEVVEVGSGVDRVKVGDQVSLPFNIGCGFCENCERGNTGFCLTVNPGTAGGAYGFYGMGPYAGGQAELLRVPYADFNCLVLPEDAQDKQNDYTMLSDIFPTGWHATELAGRRPGESVVVYGGGPVGIMAAYSAVIRGASQVFVVDRHPDRLKLAERAGATPIDDSRGDPAQQILDQTDGRGADRGCECVGYQAHDAQGNEDPSMTLNSLFQAVRPTGKIGVVGLFLPGDPGAKTEDAKTGRYPLDYGTTWFKGQGIGNGQANVKNYNRQLAQLIHQGKAAPSFIVSHELSLDDAPEAYQNFDDRLQGWTKVLLKPAA